MQKSPPLVEVTWTDSCSYGGWMESAEAIEKKPANCSTAGYLIEKTEDYVTIAQSLSDSDDDVGELICIPCVVIDELRQLERPSN